jgi:endonuclease/exonuclease/phosphatase family metal-dependent hydrolase
MTRWLAAAAVALCLTSARIALGQTATGIEPLRVISWNVESGGSDPATIAKQLAELGRHDVFALQEVHPRDADRYGQAIRSAYGRQYRYLFSHTGRSDRLLIAFDSERLVLENITELFQQGSHRLNDWQHRSPFVATFRDTKSNQRFAFITVHLARGNAELRTEQARGLAEWVTDVRLPIIAIGDFNMDYDFHTQQGNEAFKVFVAAPILKWVKPAKLVDTNWADSDRDGKDDYPDSLLDFAWVAGPAREWTAEAVVVVREGDFPDNAKTSDHRPLTLRVAPTSNSSP